MYAVIPEVSKLISTLKPYWLRYYPDEFERVFQQADAKLQEEQLTIQVYGAYNAGKSTLINVLLGENRAETGEVPTTDRIDAYHWQGYQLLDSPGVNAPIAHEKTSLVALKQNDLILMVIRQDDQDAKDVYERLFACLQEGKQVFIILNYNGLDPDKAGEGGVSLLVDQVYCILLDMAEKKGISVEQLQGNVKVLPIQLASALKARIENKPLLLSRSGYVDFIYQFEAWVKSYDNEQHFVASLTRYFHQHLIIPLLEKCSIEAQGEIKQVHQLILQLQLQRDNLISASVAQARHLVSAQKITLLQAIQQSETDSVVQQQFNVIFQGVYQSLNQWIQQQGEQAKLALSQQNIQLDAIRTMDDTQDEMSDKVLDLGVEAFKGLGNTENMTQVLLQLRAFKVPLFKGRWETTLAKWAGKAAPLLQVGLAIFDIFRESSLEATRNQQQASQALQAHQLVETISQEVLHKIQEDVRQGITVLFAPLLSEQEEKKVQLNSQTSQLESDAQAIQLLDLTLRKLTPL